MVLGVGPGPFFGLAAVSWHPSRRIDGIEPKRPFDRHVACRIEGFSEDLRFIMRPVFLVALGFEVTAHAGRSR